MPLPTHNKFARRDPTGLTSNYLPQNVESSDGDEHHQRPPPSHPDGEASNQSVGLGDLSHSTAISESATSSGYIPNAQVSPAVDPLTQSLLSNISGVSSTQHPVTNTDVPTSADQSQQLGTARVSLLDTRKSGTTTANLSDEPAAALINNNTSNDAVTAQQVGTSIPTTTTTATLNAVGHPTYGQFPPTTIPPPAPLPDPTTSGSSSHANPVTTQQGSAPDLTNKAPSLPNLSQTGPQQLNLTPPSGVSLNMISSAPPSATPTYATMVATTTLPPVSTTQPTPLSTWQPPSTAPGTSGQTSAFNNNMIPNPVPSNPVPTSIVPTSLAPVNTPQSAVSATTGGVTQAAPQGVSQNPNHAITGNLLGGIQTGITGPMVGSTPAVMQLGGLNPPTVPNQTPYVPPGHQSVNATQVCQSSTLTGVPGGAIMATQVNTNPPHQAGTMPPPQQAGLMQNAPHQLPAGPLPTIAPLQPLGPTPIPMPPPYQAGPTTMPPPYQAGPTMMPPPYQAGPTTMPPLYQAGPTMMPPPHQAGPTMTLPPPQAGPAQSLPTNPTLPQDAMMQMMAVLMQQQQQAQAAREDAQQRAQAAQQQQQQQLMMTMMQQQQQQQQHQQQQQQQQLLAILAQQNEQAQATNAANITQMSAAHTPIIITRNEDKEKLPTFDGTKDFMDFKRRFLANVGNDPEMTDERKLQKLRQKLLGKANDWLIVTEEINPGMTYDEVMDEMCKRYQPQLNTLQHLEHLKSITNPGTTLQFRDDLMAYYSKYIRHSDEVSGSIKQKSLKDAFVKGLHPVIETRLGAPKRRTLEELVDDAVDLETLHQDEIQANPTATSPKASTPSTSGKKAEKGKRDDQSKEWCDYHKKFGHETAKCYKYANEVARQTALGQSQPVLAIQAPPQTANVAPQPAPVRAQAPAQATPIITPVATTPPAPTTAQPARTRPPRRQFIKYGPCCHCGRDNHPADLCHDLPENKASKDAAHAKRMARDAAKLQENNAITATTTAVKISTLPEANPPQVENNAISIQQQCGALETTMAPRKNDDRSQQPGTARVSLLDTRKSGTTTANLLDEPAAGPIQPNNTTMAPRKNDDQSQQLGTARVSLLDTRKSGTTTANLLDEPAAALIQPNNTTAPPDKKTTASIDAMETPSVEVQMKPPVSVSTVGATANTPADPAGEEDEPEWGHEDDRIWISASMGHFKIRGLVDQGSQITVMGLDAFRQTLGKEGVRLQYTRCTGVAFAKQSVDFVGQFKLCVRIGDLRRMVTFVVSNSASNALILGMDVVRKFRITYKFIEPEKPTHEPIIQAYANGQEIETYNREPTTHPDKAQNSLFTQTHKRALKTRIGPTTRTRRGLDLAPPYPDPELELYESENEDADPRESDSNESNTSPRRKSSTDSGNSTTSQSSSPDRGSKWGQVKRQRGGKSKSDTKPLSDDETGPSEQDPNKTQAVIEQDIELNPASITFINLTLAKTTESPEIKDGQSVIVQLDPETTFDSLNEDVDITRGYFRVKKGRIYNVPVHNFSRDRVSLKKGQLIARVTKAELVSELNHDDVDPASIDAVEINPRCDLYDLPRGPMHKNQVTTDKTDPEKPQEIIRQVLSFEDEYLENRCAFFEELVHQSDTQTTDPALPYKVAITHEHLDVHQRRLLGLVLQNNDKSFAKDDHDIGHAKDVEHRIKLKPDAQPNQQRCRPIPIMFKEAFAKEIKAMLERGTIRRSHSPWASPTVIVRKKDGGIRICVDYRSLNDMTIKDSYPLPNIPEMLSNAAGNEYYAAMDLQQGFHNIAVAEEDKEKTAFVCPYGLYEYNVMPYGVCNGPPTFQRDMTSTVKNIPTQNIDSFIDDVLNASPDFVSHLYDISVTLGALADKGYKLKGSKCSFAQPEIAYLGHIVNKAGIRPNPEKVATITDCKPPTTTKQVRTFLGITGYYRQFVHMYASHAAPLYEIANKRTPTRKFSELWTPACQKAFENLKEQLASAPLLAYADSNKPFKVYTDASGVGIGFILAQDDDKGVERVLHYGSKKLIPAELSYHATELECLAIVRAFQTFHMYLLGNPNVTIITDNKPMLNILDKKRPLSQQAKRLGRLALKLQEYEYTVVHREGKSNQNADALSRPPFIDAPDDVQFKEVGVQTAGTIHEIAAVERKITKKKRRPEDKTDEKAPPNTEVNYLKDDMNRPQTLGRATAPGESLDKLDGFPNLAVCGSTSGKQQMSYKATDLTDASIAHEEDKACERNRRVGASNLVRILNEQRGEPRDTDAVRRRLKKRIEKNQPAEVQATEAVPPREEPVAPPEPETRRPTTEEIMAAARQRHQETHVGPISHLPPNRVANQAITGKITAESNEISMQQGQSANSRKGQKGDSDCNARLNLYDWKGKTVASTAKSGGTPSTKPSPSVPSCSGTPPAKSGGTPSTKPSPSVPSCSGTPPAKSGGTPSTKPSPSVPSCSGTPPAKSGGTPSTKPSPSIPSSSGSTQPAKSGGTPTMASPPVPNKSVKRRQRRQAKRIQKEALASKSQKPCHTDRNEPDTPPKEVSALETITQPEDPVPQHQVPEVAHEEEVHAEEAEDSSDDDDSDSSDSDQSIDYEMELDEEAPPPDEVERHADYFALQPPWQPQIIIDGQDDDERLASLKYLMINQQHEADTPPEHKKWAERNEQNFVIRDGILYRAKRTVCPPRGDRLQFLLVVPANLRQQLIEQYHFTHHGGHDPPDKIAAKISRRYWWPRMISDVMTQVDTCVPCARFRAGPNRTAPMRPITAVRPNHIIGMDIIGPYDPTTKGNRYVLATMDYFTKWPEAYPIPDQTTATVLDIIQHEFIPRFTTPQIIMSDQGSCFMSAEFQRALQKLGIQQRVSQAYHHQANGLVERWGQTLQSIIKPLTESKDEEWDYHLNYACGNYRSTIHATTGDTPHYLTYGYDAVLPGDNAYTAPGDGTSIEGRRTKLATTLKRARDIALENIEVNQGKYTAYFNRKARTRHFMPGQLLVMKVQGGTRGQKGGKMAPKFDKLFRVLEVEYPNLIVERLSAPRSPPKKMHSNLFKQFGGSAEDYLRYEERLRTGAGPEAEPRDHNTLCHQCGEQDDVLRADFQEVMWIQCDQCSEWYHYQCVGLEVGPMDDGWLCPDCDDQQEAQHNVQREHGYSNRQYVAAATSRPKSPESDAMARIDAMASSLSTLPDRICENLTRHLGGIKPPTTTVPTTKPLFTMEGSATMTEATDDKEKLGQQPNRAKYPNQGITANPKLSQTGAKTTKSSDEASATETKSPRTIVLHINSIDIQGSNRSANPVMLSTLPSDQTSTAKKKRREPTPERAGSTPQRRKETPADDKTTPTNHSQGRTDHDGERNRDDGRDEERDGADSRELQHDATLTTDGREPTPDQSPRRHQKSRPSHTGNPDQSQTGTTEREAKRRRRRNRATRSRAQQEKDDTEELQDSRYRQSSRSSNINDTDGDSGALQGPPSTQIKPRHNSQSINTGPFPVGVNWSQRAQEVHGGTYRDITSSTSRHSHHSASRQNEKDHRAPTDDNRRQPSPRRPRDDQRAPEADDTRRRPSSRHQGDDQRRRSSRSQERRPPRKDDRRDPTYYRGGGSSR